MSMEPAETPRFLLRYEPLDESERRIEVPCNAGGQVNLAALDEALRHDYFYARIMRRSRFAEPVVIQPLSKGAYRAMPFAQIYILEGRTEEQKREVIEKVTQALVEAVGAPKENVRVWIHDVPKTNWGIAGVSAKDLGR